MFTLFPCLGILQVRTSMIWPRWHFRDFHMVQASMVFEHIWPGIFQFHVAEHLWVDVDLSFKKINLTYAWKGDLCIRNIMAKLIINWDDSKWRLAIGTVRDVGFNDVLLQSLYLWKIAQLRSICFIGSTRYVYVVYNLFHILRKLGAPLRKWVINPTYPSDHWCDRPWATDRMPPWQSSLRAS